MSNTYTQIFIHLVFAVKYRQAQIPLRLAERVHQYMATVINNTKNCQTISIGGISDHVHLLIRLSSIVNVAELVKSVKVATIGFIKTVIAPGVQFAWQEGYGAFSVSATHTDAVVKYIQNQPNHHLSTSFLAEYKKLLDVNKIEYDSEYIFRDLE